MLVWGRSLVLELVVRSWAVSVSHVGMFIVLKTPLNVDEVSWALLVSLFLFGGGGEGGSVVGMGGVDHLPVPWLVWYLFSWCRA